MMINTRINTRLNTRMNLVHPGSKLNPIESYNLANFQTSSVVDVFVGNNGIKYAGAGWLMLKIDVSAFVGEYINIGNFKIDTAGYAAFYDNTALPDATGSVGLIQALGAAGSYADLTSSSKKYLIPENSKWFYFDIKRPTNVIADYEMAICNIGDTLLPYRVPYTLIATNVLQSDLCNIYNNHNFVFNINTDSIDAAKWDVNELKLFQYNVPATAFLLRNHTNQTKIDSVKSTDRVKFGVYFETDYWVNPETSIVEYIPDYYATAWTEAGVAVFENAVLGVPKNARTPNHGQQLYDISNGAYGYDFVNNQAGLSNLSELHDLILLSQTYYETAIGKNASGFSYRNGRNDGAKLFLPHFLAGRNSDFSLTGDSDTQYKSILREQFINKKSSTRTWDAVAYPEFDTQEESINYSKTQIQKAIAENGFYSDFTHLHSLYTNNDLAYLDLFLNAVKTEVTGNDGWLTGFGEAAEYEILRQNIDRVYTTENNGVLYGYLKIKDKYLNTTTNGISNAVDEKFYQTPISITVNLSGTALAGKEIRCPQAEIVRKISTDNFVLSINHFGGEYISFEIKEEVETPDYYDSTIPTITNDAGAITTDIDCKFAIWRRSTAEGIETTVEFARQSTLSQSYSLTIEAGYSYYVGAISKYGMSNLIEI